MALLGYNTGNHSHNRLVSDGEEKEEKSLPLYDAMI
jgi:hypothetical protein